MTQPSGEGPQLTRIGGGRSARTGALVAMVVLGVSVAIALADRLPSDRRPRPSMAVSIASPTLTPSATPAPSATPTASPAATRVDPPSALDRGNGWPPVPSADPVARFELRLLSYQVVMDEVPISTTDGVAAGRLAVPATAWHTPAWLQLRWLSGRDERADQQLAMIALSLGSADALGLPIELASGQALLPRRLDGTRHWDYVVTLERTHPYSAPDEWIASVQLLAGDAPAARPAEQAAPLILLTASPWQPRRATRTHGISWVAGR